MDAFFASIEQRDNPTFKGKPVIIGGSPESRSVVATCSYEARKYGIRSAMPCREAYRRCPQAIFVATRIEAYKDVSSKIMEIFYEYTDLVEPLSLDEAFLDVTCNKKRCPSATIIAQDIRKNIYDTTKLTASAGVSFNKFLAKLASDHNKPDGVTVILPGQEDSFLAPLNIRRFYGVGIVTEKKMKRLGITTGADLKKRDREELINTFGKMGSYYYDIAHGHDSRPVTPLRAKQSIGKEITLAEDIDSIDKMRQILCNLAYSVEQRL